MVDDLTVRYTSASSVESGRSVRNLGGLLPASRPSTVTAVRRMSFVAREGDFIGLVGRNGSGKSTLLRAIAGLEVPASGRVLASDQPQFLGVDAALIPDLSGHQNAVLGCLAMGMRPQQAERAARHIEEFAGLGSAIHRPMKTYSSGMGARLKFSISMVMRPRILLVDEALSTGDAGFMDKSRAVMSELLEQAGTVFLVSHAAQTIEETCRRALWIDSGRLVLDGDAVDVARKYRWYAHNLAQGETEKAEGLLTDAFAEGRAQRQERLDLDAEIDTTENVTLTVSEQDATSPDRRPGTEPLAGSHLNLDRLNSRRAQPKIFPAAVSRPDQTRTASARTGERREDYDD